MTQSIQGLIVDDSRQNLSSVTTRLSQYLLQQQWRVEWTKLRDPDHAHQTLSGSDRFDLVVIDLLFARPDMDVSEARGLELVELARSSSPHAYVLVISNGDQNRHDLFYDALQRGAHKVVLRREFTLESSISSPVAVAAEIRKHLLDNGSVTEVRVTADHNDPSVQSLLFEVKEATLSQLHSQVLLATNDFADSVHVRFLSPGASGASVCETTAKLRHGPTVHNVIKLSRAFDELLSETQHALRARQLLPSRFVVPIQPERPVGPVNGWYATGAQRDHEVVTLRRWLASNEAEAQAGELFEVLFTDCLGQMYREHMEERPVNPLSLFEFPYYKQRLILHAMDELMPTLTRAEGGGLCDISSLSQDLTAFTIEQRLVGVLTRQLPPSSQVTQLHGDLHGGNILLYRGKHPTPALIDFSDFGEAHWAGDAARLVVDLVMRVVDHGAESMFFTGFPVWRKLMVAIGDLSPDLQAVSTTAPTAGALAGLTWIVENLRGIFPTLTSDEDFAAHHWEWHIALCVHLLRSIYHYDIAGPKRALALVAAHDQLVAGAAVFDGSKKL